MPRNCREAFRGYAASPGAAERVKEDSESPVSMDSAIYNTFSLHVHLGSFLPPLEESCPKCQPPLEADFQKWRWKVFFLQEESKKQRQWDIKRFKSFCEIFGFWEFDIVLKDKGFGVRETWIWIPFLFGSYGALSNHYSLEGSIYSSVKWVKNICFIE